MPNLLNWDDLLEVPESHSEPADSFMHVVQGEDEQHGHHGAEGGAARQEYGHHGRWVEP